MTVDQLSAALVDALALDHGGGLDAGLDLSAAGQVLRGPYNRPPRVPFACVAGSSISGERGKGYALRQWGYQHEWVIRAWIPSTALDLESRVLRGELVMQTLVGALTDAASDSGSALYGVPDLRFQSITLDAEVDGGPEVVQVAIVVSCSTSRSGAP